MSSVDMLTEPTAVQRRRRLGAVYTPRVLAEWVATELLSVVETKQDPLRILDPACGDGELLDAVRALSTGPVHTFGIELDPEAAAAARGRLGPTASVFNMDRLLDPRCRTIGRDIDAVIANPPWGADLSGFGPALSSSGLTLAQGQFDSYALFIERSLADAPDGVPMAFIVPDSLFGPEHRALRALLATTSRIHLLARLGEGFFPGIFRGAAVLVFTSGPPPRDQQVSCLRLRAADRRRVLQGDMTLAQVRRSQSHRVQQSRFTAHPQRAFDIDVRSSDRGPVTRMSENSSSWRRWVRSGRGVELGKDGLVVCCPLCRRFRPVPQRGPTSCAGCGSRYDATTERPIRIVKVDQPHDDRGWAPLIVGSDVQRYRAQPSRWIQLGLTGINYKVPADFASRKLLVRKTGIGLNAAVDESGAYTNQVVFQFHPLPDSPPFILDYLAGVLSSRILLALHLRSTGEDEWRSHPYVTPKSLAELPIPDIGSEGSRTWRQAAAIAISAAARSSVDVAHDSEEDLRVERLVAGMYNVTAGDCAWALNVLNSAQGLRTIAPLRLSPHTRLEPLLID